jgi:hypothetical protein
MLTAQGKITMYTMKPSKNQDALTKYAHVLNTMTLKNIRNISEIHTRAIRGMAESMQRRMVEIGSIRDPLTISNLWDEDEINEITDRVHEYQHEIANASQEISREWQQLIGAWSQDYKEGVNTSLNDAEANAPDGLDVFVSPLKSSFDNAFMNLSRMQGLSLKMFDEIKHNMDGLMNGAQAQEHGSEERQSNAKRKDMSKIPVIQGKKKRQ